MGRDRYTITATDGSGIQLESPSDLGALRVVAELARRAGKVGRYTIRHRGNDWGTLDVKGDCWSITGPDGRTIWPTARVMVPCSAVLADARDAIQVGHDGSPSQGAS